MSSSLNDSAEFGWGRSVSRVGVEELAVLFVTTAIATTHRARAAVKTWLCVLPVPTEVCEVGVEGEFWLEPVTAASCREANSLRE